MTEASYFWTTNDTGDGPTAGYAQTALFNIFRMLAAKTANAGGVSPDFSNELAVSGTATPVSVAAGGAVVYGIPYFNDAAVTVAIATPAANTRIDRVVLRASWSNQTVRVTRIAGSEGGAAPALTQSAGATWDIPLAQVSITTGGAITVTDERQWLDMTGDGSVVADKIASGVVSNAKLANMAQATIKGRASGAGTGVPVDLTAAQARTILNVADGANAYVHPNHSGAVTSTGDGATAIANNAVDPRIHISGTNGIVIDPQNGNARGADAVDLQTSRASAADVASGELSAVLGGFSNTANAFASVALGGQGNIAGGQYSVAYGKDANARRNGQVAHGAGETAQTGQYILAGTTTTATPTELYLLGDGASRLVLPNENTWVFDILIVARRLYVHHEGAAYRAVGCIDRNAVAVDTALMGTVTKTVIAEDNAAWDVAVTANAVDGALRIQVTGENSKTIRWVAFVRTVEVTG